MWWLWPHLRRLWAAAGTVSAGLAVNYFYMDGSGISQHRPSRSLPIICGDTAIA
jgi:hypothetical protein